MYKTDPRRKMTDIYNFCANHDKTLMTRVCRLRNFVGALILKGSRTNRRNYANKHVRTDVTLYCADLFLFISLLFRIIFTRKIQQFE